MTAEHLGPEQFASRLVRAQVETAEVPPAQFSALAEQLVAAYPNVQPLTAQTIIMNALDNRF